MHGRVGSTWSTWSTCGAQLNSSPALSQDERAEAEPTASYETRRCCSVFSPSFFHHPLFLSSAPALQNVKSVSPVRGGKEKESNEKTFLATYPGLRALFLSCLALCRGGNKVCCFLWAFCRSTESCAGGDGTSGSVFSGNVRGARQAERELNS